MMPKNARSSSFISDDVNSVDDLIKACEKVVTDAPVVERALVPYFDFASESNAIADVQRKLMTNGNNSSIGRKNNRSGSPTSSLHEMVKGSRPVKVAKGARPPAVLLNAHKLATSPPRSPTTVAAAVATATPVRAPAAAAATAVVVIVAACPAIFKSPKPSDLPMPSSALLRRISFTDVPAAMNMMPLAMPIMAAA